MLGARMSGHRRRLRRMEIVVSQLRNAVRLFEDLLQDLRYSLRSLGRSPGFTVTALVTLALTIGAVSTVLSLYYAILLRPIAAPRPEELVIVAAVRRGSPSSERVSYADYAHIRDRTTTLRDLAAHGSGGLFFLTHDGMTKKLSPSIIDRKSTRLNSSHRMPSRMPSSA